MEWAMQALLAIIQSSPPLSPDLAGNFTIAAILFRNEKETMMAS
jgi:hypothetical protein